MVLLSSNNPLDSDHDRWDTRQEQVELTHNYHSLRYVTYAYSAEHIVDVMNPTRVTGRFQCRPMQAKSCSTGVTGKCAGGVREAPKRGEVRFDIGVAVPGIFRELPLQFWR